MIARTVFVDAATIDAWEDMLAQLRGRTRSTRCAWRCREDWPWQPPRYSDWQPGSCSYVEALADLSGSGNCQHICLDDSNGVSAPPDPGPLVIDEWPEPAFEWAIVR